MGKVEIVDRNGDHEGVRFSTVRGPVIALVSQTSHFERNPANDNAADNRASRRGRTRTQAADLPLRTSFCGHPSCQFDRSIRLGPRVG